MRAAFFGVSLTVVLVALLPEVALAQPGPRQKPVLRTPLLAPKTGAPPTGAAGATPTPLAPTGQNTGAPKADPNAGGGTGAGGPGKVDPNDPMAAVKQAQAEIDFKPKPGNYQVSFNLDNADLAELVKAISQITGKRFIYGSKLKSITATVYSPEKVTAAEAYAAFLAILEQNGLTVVPQGQFMKIIDSQGVVQQTTPIFGTGAPVPAEDRYVTRLYRLSNVDATEMVGLLQKFQTKDANITAYPAGNLLIITDTGTNIRRMLRIVEEVDVGSAGDQIWVQPVHNSSAEETAGKLNEILNLKGGKTGAAGTASANIIPDERTNSLIITATKNDYDRILELLKRVDTPLSGDSQLHVLPLQHAKCADLSTTLNQILGSGTGARATGAAAAGGRGNAAAAAPRPAGGAGASASGGGDDIFEGQVKTACDESTNALVTTSSLRDYVQLRAVIDRLDQPRRQVFIEAVIMDLNIDRTTDWGVGYHGGAPFTIDNRQSFFYGGNNPGQSILGVPANLEALALGIRGPEIEGSQNLFGTGVSIPALGVVLHALAKDSDSNVLATPHILATDGVDAEISIGQDIPLQTNLGNLGSLAGAAGGDAALSGLSGLLTGGLGGAGGGRRDVGTKITVKPYINDSDQVRMELTEEISELGGRDGALGAASINKRNAKTTLTVRDQQTVVIGGLMRDQVVVGESKVPILGDIPILGLLFKQQVRQKQKTNLLLILTPYVIRDQEDLRKIFERKMQERQEFLDRYFIFNDGAEWEPPMDFSRKNGLLEIIRHTMVETEEERQIEEDARPKGPTTHDPVEPVQLPSMAQPKSAGTQGAGATGAVDVNPTSPTTTTGPTPGGTRGRVRPTPGTQRVE